MRGQPLAYGQVRPTGPNTSAEQYRDVGPDKWGFKFRQYASGHIYVLSAPVTGNFGDYILGTTGGDLQGQTLNPGSTIWAKITAQIGVHPYQRALAEIARRQGYAGYGAAPWVETLEQVASGFTLEPKGDTGAITSTFVEAVPGIQAAIGSLTTPATLEGMSKKLGKLKGKLAAERDPVKRAMLSEQIGALEYKIVNVKAAMSADIAGAELPGGGMLPWIVGGTGLLALAILATRTRGRRRRP